jgi:hypothetical protein
MRIGRCVALCLPGVLFLSGCGDGKVVKATGTLTHKGQPVKDALLNFLPANGRQTWAETDEQGKFKINYDQHQDGVVVGKNKVWIEFRPKVLTDPDKAPVPPKELRAVFEKYSFDNSKLEVEITSSTRDLEIKLD